MPSNSKRPRLDHGMQLQQLPTFSKRSPRCSKLKASGSHAEILLRFLSISITINTDHLARPFFSGPNVKEKSGLGGETKSPIPTLSPMPT